MSVVRSTSNPVVETFAGFTAGVVATLVAHPLDLVKTRLQVAKDTGAVNLGESLRILRRIIRSEGGYRALYRGLAPNLIGNSSSWALYFLSYGQAKNVFKRLRDEAQLSYGDYFIASGTAGLLTAACTNPIWVIKTRMLSTSASFEGAYRSTYDGVRNVYRVEGIRGFYRGFVPSAIGVCHGALQFMVYERIKIFYQERNHGQNDRLSNKNYLIASGFSKLVAGVATYPYQVVRSRLQTYDASTTYNGVLDVIRQTVKKEGPQGFYRGLMPNVLRVLPSTCVTFVVYENTKNWLYHQGS